jgi:hypothetical protein
MADSYYCFGIMTMRLVLILIALLWSYIAPAAMLISDNGTNHRAYQIVGWPWCNRTIESSGSQKGINYQYRVAIDDNESNPNTVKWAKRRSSPPQTEFGDNTTGVALSASGNATIDGYYYFDLGNATGYSLGYAATYTTVNTGYLSTTIPNVPKHSRDITIWVRAIGDNDTKSDWVEFVFRRSADGNFTNDNETDPVEDPPSVKYSQPWGCYMR